ncbi:MAG: tRNA epoxyqueuosine(34) reductase QueG [Gemmataceae bacterium]
MQSLESQLKQYAREIRFSLVGIAAAGPADHFDRFEAWLDQGYQGQMAYMQDQAEARRRPDAILPDVRSVIMLGMDDDQQVESQPGDHPIPKHPAKVARFARGGDYHQVLWDRLRQIQVWLERAMPGCRTRGVADSAPLLEREFARRAGLGWFGKNTMLINKHRGSFILLGAVLTDVKLKPDEAHERAHCGTCTACLEACPTDAFPAPGVLDARKCISYLNIEVKGPIPEQHRKDLGDWLYGCDICQDVCPWNRKAYGGPDVYEAEEILALTPDEYNRRFRHTTMHRAKRRGLARNAAIILGNTGDPEALSALRSALSDTEESVRDAAAWAIEQIESRIGGH